MTRRQLDQPGAQQSAEGRDADAASQAAGGYDDAGCPILHVDMDAFYASVSLLDHPELRGTPVIVGGGTRGVVLSATYEARRLGVHSAMPMTRARRLAPQATILAPDHDRYSRVSAAVMEVFRSITPLVEPLSLDEAFLDVSGSRRRLGSPAQIGELIKARIHDEQGITCTVGVAPNKFLAKLASTRGKPDGLLVVPAAEVVGFLHPLPVGALWGVGEKTEEVLLRLGLRTVGDIALIPQSTLERALGPAMAAHLAALAWGRDERYVVAREPDKSVGNEETFAHDVDDPVVVRRELLRLSEKVAARLRSAGYSGRTITLKVRFADFTTITRSRTVRDPTDVAADIFATVSGLYDALGLERARLRLVGVRAEGLVDSDTRPEQLLLDAPEHGRRDAELAVDAAARRFGAGAVRPGTLLGGERQERSRRPPQGARDPVGGSSDPPLRADDDTE